MWGDRTFLDHMDADIIEVNNSAFTCRGKEGTTGGSMIDYYLISRGLLAMPVGCEADFDSAWSPHYGIELRIRAKPKEVINYVIKEPSLPKNIVNFGKGLRN